MRTKDSTCSGVFFLCKGHYSANWPNRNKTCGLGKGHCMDFNFLMFVYLRIPVVTQVNVLACRTSMLKYLGGKRASCLQFILKLFREVRMHVRAHNYSV